MDNHYFYEPSKGHGLAHDPLNAIIGPRPIGWISSRDKTGARNLAPYSFFNCFNYSPPIIGFASVGYKDSLANIIDSDEFVWNLTTRQLAEKMNLTSANLPPNADEFAFAGLTPTPSTIVAADRVSESPVNFECKLSQCIQLQAANGDKIDTWLVLGEVVAVHIAKHLLNSEGIYQTALAEPILRAGGPSAYYTISDTLRFDLARPKLPE
ncbi:flavin reductase family protein [Shewanella colwelliana]|uniref:flavin reductase family protein n=1 Tax=Shewanella colwelliana TaxID=23 RepID=UPI00373629E1